MWKLAEWLFLAHARAIQRRLHHVLLRTLCLAFFCGDGILLALLRIQACMSRFLLFLFVLSNVTLPRWLSACIRHALLLCNQPACCLFSFDVWLVEHYIPSVGVFFRFGHYMNFMYFYSDDVVMSWSHCHGAEGKVYCRITGIFWQTCGSSSVCAFSTYIVAFCCLILSIPSVLIRLVHLFILPSIFSLISGTAFRRCFLHDISMVIYNACSIWKASDLFRIVWYFLFVTFVVVVQYWRGVYLLPAVFYTVIIHCCSVSDLI